MQVYERHIEWAVAPTATDPRLRPAANAVLGVVLPLPVFALEVWDEESDLSWSETPAEGALLDDAASFQGGHCSLNPPKKSKCNYIPVKHHPVKYY